MSEVALVTGAGSGIGRAIAIALASRDAELILLDVTEEKCNDVAEEIRAAGGAAHEAVADVRFDKDLLRARHELGAVADKLSILVNCAGIFKTTPFLEITAEEWRLMLDTHLKGTFLACKNFVPSMVRQRKGIIINTASEFAIVGFPGSAHYCAAKRAIHAFTKSLAQELAPHGIRAVSIGPGPTDTPLLKGGLSEPDYEKKLAAIAMRVPLGRAGKPEDVARVAAWLALGGGSFINGQLLNVNGGSVMY